MSIHFPRFVKVNIARKVEPNKLDDGNKGERPFLLGSSNTAAARVIRSIREGVLALSANPLMGRIGSVAATRERVLSRYPYLVVYRVKKHGVSVLAVIHASRHWQVDFSRE